jgi:3-oxosteroid 1-dehydrogenase
MYEKHSDKNQHVPCYYIFDGRFRSKYMFGVTFPGMKFPQEFYDSGYINVADTVEELAKKIDVNEKNLVETIKRFNEMAVKGEDEDFSRGSNAYDNYYGDPTVKPNPNLYPLEKPPFYAVEFVPGDLGTKGGLVINEHAQVLKKNGKPIEGLYAAGNNSASVMGNSYPGPGATIGATMTFGYIAAKHIAEKK